jgi:DNA-binding NarL/FixJ family response regulator
MSPTTTTDDRLDGRVPRVVVAMSHPTMRRYVCDLIEQSCRCWLATTRPNAAELRDVIASLHPDVIVLEASRFPGCCPNMADTFPVGHVVVIGPYPDDAYRDAALTAGAGAWIPRDRLPNDLISELNRISGEAGCSCGCITPTAPPTDEATP